MDPCSTIFLDQPEFWQEKEKTDEQKAMICQRAQTLSDGQRLPLGRKIKYAVQALAMASNTGVKWALNYSGGRDSTVLSHLAVTRCGLRYPHVFVNTRIEYPETYRQIHVWRKWLSEYDVSLETILPEKKPEQVWKEEGFPLWSKKIASKYRQWFSTANDNHLRGIPKKVLEDFYKLRDRGIKISDTCCDKLKKNPLKAYDKRTGVNGHILGCRAQEAQNRRLAFIQRGSLYKSKKGWICNPLVYWKESDVEEYLDRFDIYPILSEYGGSGCRCCTFGCHLGRAPLQELHEINPKYHEKVMNDWGFHQIADILSPEKQEEQGRLFHG